MIDTAGCRVAALAANLAGIVIALLCALMPAGPQVSRSGGSAFDPLTSVVALHSRPQAARDAGQAVDADTDKDGTAPAVASLDGGTAALLPAPPAIAAVPAEPPAPAAAAATVPRPAARLLPFQARAPPIG